MTATGLSCGSCGTKLNETAKFCGECGAAVSTVKKHAEYKQVTVLFADVVRSMDRGDWFRRFGLHRDR
jgi:adenylate cyclase